MCILLSGLHTTPASSGLVSRHPSTHLCSRREACCLLRPSLLPDRWQTVPHRHSTSLSVGADCSPALPVCAGRCVRVCGRAWCAIRCSAVRGGSTQSTQTALSCCSRADASQQAGAHQQQAHRERHCELGKQSGRERGCVVGGSASTQPDASQAPPHLRWIGVC